MRRMAETMDGAQHATRSSSPAAPGSRGQPFARGGEPRGHWQRGPKSLPRPPVMLVAALVSRLALRPSPPSLGQLHRGPASGPGAAAAAASLGHAHLGPGGAAAADEMLLDDAVLVARSAATADAAVDGSPGSPAAAGAAGRRRTASSLREARRPRPRAVCAAISFFSDVPEWLF